MYGPLHYRWVDIDKTNALRQCRGNFDSPMSLSPDAFCDLRWWIDCVETACNPVSHGPSQITMTTDASKTGWVRAPVRAIPLVDLSLQPRPDLTSTTLRQR